MQKIRSMRIVMTICLLIGLLTVPLIGGASSYNNGIGLSTDKTFYAPGEEIRVKFDASGSWPSDAWIGIIPSNIQHGSERVNDQHDVTYQYIKNRTDGVMVFTAPHSGSWDLRMHDTDDSGREITYTSFTVR